MNTNTITNIAIAALELIEDGLRKVIYASDRLQEKLELHKLIVADNEQRKAADNLAKLDEALKEIERSLGRTVALAKAKAAAEREAVHAKGVVLNEKLATADAVLFEEHHHYAEKAVSRGWAV